MSLINTLKQLYDYCNKQDNSVNQQVITILKSQRTLLSTVTFQIAQEAQGQILTQTILKCQGTIQRHSDILEKEAQAPRKERKETQNKTKIKKGVGEDTQCGIKTEKKSDFLKGFK